MDWKRELVIAHLVKQEIAKIDFDGLWENTLPEVRASEEQVQFLESKLGYSVDPQYRAFLIHANGWRSFSQFIDIFGVDDLVGSARSARAIELTETLEPLEPLCGFGKNDLIPIAASSNDIDLMLMTRPHTSDPGKVFWFAGGLIDTFTGFDEWFLSMFDYLRLAHQRLVERNT